MLSDAFFVLGNIVNALKGQNYIDDSSIPTDLIVLREPANTLTTCTFQVEGKRVVNLHVYER